MELCSNKIIITTFLILVNKKSTSAFFELCLPDDDPVYTLKKVLDELNYQFLRRLQKEGLVTLKELFIDGTKIEANANRYTFVWRGSINYRLAGLLDTIDTLYTKYNTLLHENGYGAK